jgi:hypothetical protein
MPKSQDPSEQEYDSKILHAFDAENKEPKQEPELLSAEAKAKLIKEKKELTSLPDEFDVKNITDLNYLSEIFSAKYDKFKSLDFLQKTRDNMIRDGYPECGALNEFLFWATMSRRLQINYQRIHAKLISKEGVNAEEAENIDMLKEMRDISDQVGSLQKTLDALREKRQQIKDVVDLHAATMKDAEEFIKTHIGEFTFKCDCGKILNSQGLPHFAIMTEKDEQSNEIIYHIFSKELWYLFQKKLVPLHYAAFVLRTSPEGFLITAQKRGEYGSGPALEDLIALEEQENELKKLRKNYEARENI